MALERRQRLLAGAKELQLPGNPLDQVGEVGGGVGGGMLTPCLVAAVFLGVNAPVTCLGSLQLGCLCQVFDGCRFRG